jgi:hypothetical protein
MIRLTFKAINRNNNLFSFSSTATNLEAKISVTKSVGSNVVGLYFSELEKRGHKVLNLFIYYFLTSFWEVVNLKVI